MSEEKLCQNCPQSNDCQRVYQVLGNTKGPSIAGAALCAFVVPVLVFAVSMGIFDRLLSGRVEGDGLRTAVSFSFALAATLAAILLLRLVRSWGRGR